MNKKKCFVIMPFDMEFLVNYYKYIKPIVINFGIDCFIADEVPINGNLLAFILEQIKNADYIIGDMTIANSNVMYELGAAYMDKKTGKGNKEIILLKRVLEDKAPCHNKETLKDSHCWYRRYWNTHEICSDLNGEYQFREEEDQLSERLKSFLSEKGNFFKQKVHNTKNWDNSLWKGFWEFENISNEIELLFTQNNKAKAKIVVKKNRKVYLTLTEIMDVFRIGNNILMTGIKTESQSKKIVYNNDLMLLKINNKGILTGKVYCNTNRKGANITLAQER